MANDRFLKTNGSLSILDFNRVVTIWCCVRTVKNKKKSENYVYSSAISYMVSLLTLLRFQANRARTEKLSL